MAKQLVSFCIIILFVGQISKAANVAGLASARKVAPCRVEQTGVYAALEEISQRTGIVIGVDAMQPEKEPSISLDFPGGTVADLLNLLTSKAPDYTWQEDTPGTIRVSRSNSHVSLADVVMDYPGAINKTRKQIWEDIATRPEIAAWLNSNRCSRGELFSGWEFREHNDPISIAPGSIKLSDLLDKVAAQSGVNYWAILQSAPGTPCRSYIIVW
jgi:hypothetical protein